MTPAAFRRRNATRAGGKDGWEARGQQAPDGGAAGLAPCFAVDRHDRDPAQAATWKAGTISCGSGYQVTLYSNAYGREIWHRWGRTSYTNKRVFRLRNPYQYQTDVTRTGYQAVYWRIDAVGNGPHGGPRLAGWDAICQR
jgi:hypothetical protein